MEQRDHSPIEWKIAHFLHNIAATLDIPVVVVNQVLKPIQTMLNITGFWLVRRRRKPANLGSDLFFPIWRRKQSKTSSWINLVELRTHSCFSLQDSSDF